MKKIDFVEAVNQANLGNQIILYTSDSCSISVRRQERGTALTTNCLNSTNSKVVEWKDQSIRIDHR